MKTIKPGKASSLRHGGPKDSEKMKNFMIKVNEPTDIFGEPKELPMAKDNVLIGVPKPPNIQKEISPEYKSPSNEVGNEYTPLFKMMVLDDTF